MGKEKAGALTPKAISNRIKAKGLQKLRWYCQMCQKQCRDEVHVLWSPFWNFFKVDIDICEPNNISCTSPLPFLGKEWIQVPHYVGITSTPAFVISRRCWQVHGHFL